MRVQVDPALEPSVRTPWLHDHVSADYRSSGRLFDAFDPKSEAVKRSRPAIVSGGDEELTVAVEALHPGRLSADHERSEPAGGEHERASPVEQRAAELARSLRRREHGPSSVVRDDDAGARAAPVNPMDGGC